VDYYEPITTLVARELAVGSGTFIDVGACQRINERSAAELKGDHGHQSKRRRIYAIQKGASDRRFAKVGDNKATNDGKNIPPVATAAPGIASQQVTDEC
jgi:hypothetical protein